MVSNGSNYQQSVVTTPEHIILWKNYLRRFTKKYVQGRIRLVYWVVNFASLSSNQIIFKILILIIDFNLCLSYVIHVDFVCVFTSNAIHYPFLWQPQYHVISYPLLCVLSPHVIRYSFSCVCLTRLPHFTTSAHDNDFLSLYQFLPRPYSQHAPWSMH